MYWQNVWFLQTTQRCCVIRVGMHDNLNSKENDFFMVYFTKVLFDNCAKYGLQYMCLWYVCFALRIVCFDFNNELFISFYFVWLKSIFYGLEEMTFSYCEKNKYPESKNFLNKEIVCLKSITFDLTMVLIVAAFGENNESSKVYFQWNAVCYSWMSPTVSRPWKYPLRRKSYIRIIDDTSKHNKVLIFWRKEKVLS